MTLDARQDTLLKLNLGCGGNKIEGFLNVDKFGEPDFQWDLEVFPWPWADNSVGHVVMSHVLEHLGADPDVFIGIMKELHRVCAPGAIIEIAVPHWRHDNFTGDPTHVRVINAQVMSLFDAEQCRAWQEQGFANTPLALYHGVDFKLVAHKKVPDWRYEKVPAQNLEQLERDLNNVIAEIRMVLEVRK